VGGGLEKYVRLLDMKIFQVQELTDRWGFKGKKNGSKYRFGGAGSQAQTTLFDIKNETKMKMERGVCRDALFTCLFVF